MSLPTNSAARSRNQIKEARLEIVADLYRKGWSMRKIREEVVARLKLTKYSRDTLWRDIQKLLAEWRESRLNDVDQAVQLELSRIDDTVRELWDQWEKSKEDYERRSTKQKGVPVKEEGKAETIKTFQTERTTTHVLRLGDTAYIAEIRAQLVERRKLLGLYKPEKREVTGKDGTPLHPDKVDVKLDEFTPEERQYILKIARKVGADDD